MNYLATALIALYLWCGAVTAFYRWWTVDLKGRYAHSWTFVAGSTFTLLLWPLTLMYDWITYLRDSEL